MAPAVWWAVGWVLLASTVYYYSASTLVNGRGAYCLRVGGVQLDKAVSRSFLDIVAPVAIEAALLAEEQLQADEDCVGFDLS